MQVARRSQPLIAAATFGVAFQLARRRSPRLVPRADCCAPTVLCVWVALYVFCESLCESRCDSIFWKVCAVNLRPHMIIYVCGRKIEKLRYLAHEKPLACGEGWQPLSRLLLIAILSSCLLLRTALKIHLFLKYNLSSVKDRFEIKCPLENSPPPSYQYKCYVT